MLSGDNGMTPCTATTSRFDTFAEVMPAAEESWGNTVFDFGNGNRLTLEGVRVSELTVNDFTFALF
jgi:hypothetical protein